MGFGFNLFAVFVLPVLILLSVIFLIYFLSKKDYTSVKAILKGWGVFFLIILSIAAIGSVIRYFTDKMEVDQDDVYGTYVIDRTKYPGRQSEWQYKHFRFEITRSDSLIFHLMEKEKIVKAYKGKVIFKERGRIVLKMDSPSIKVLADTPTLYRNTTSFYYAFYSSNYNNVFFKKGKWRNDNSN